MNKVLELNQYPTSKLEAEIKGITHYSLAFRAGMDTFQNEEQLTINVSNVKVNIEDSVRTT